MEEHPLDEDYRHLYRQKKAEKMQKIKGVQKDVKKESAEQSLKNEYDAKIREYTEKLDKEYKEKHDEVTASVEREKAELLKQIEERKRAVRLNQDELTRKEKERYLDV
jgi:hypothetical protein